MAKNGIAFMFEKTGMHLALLAILAAALMAFAGCSSEKKSAPKAEAPKGETQKTEAAPQATLPEGHTPVEELAQDIQKMSHSNIKTTKEVNLSDEVKNTWKNVTLEITDFSSQQTASVNFEVGSKVKLNDEGLRLQVEVFVPDYIIVEEGRIESRSNEPNNPAVLISLLKDDEAITRGWVFRDFPQFNSFNDSRFGVSLVSPEKPAEGKGAPAK